MSNATSWFKSLGIFGGPKKEKGKGFEVVRSARMPPQMIPLEEDGESPTMPQEPYKDSPGSGSPSKVKESMDQGNCQFLDDEDFIVTMQSADARATWNGCWEVE